jgi:hypothetical protein
VELSFSLSDYLAPIRPVCPPDVMPAEGRHGWFRVADAAFRLPTVGDQIAVLALPDVAAELAARCLDPADLRNAVRGRVERAMARMAPEVSRPVTGRCPACAATMRAALHMPALVVSELRRASAWVLDEVHLIAGAYGWSEAAILALPDGRRQDYARRIRRQAA